MKYSRILIFYFSGTGNAKSAARWIIDYAKANNIESQLINISEANEIEPSDLSLHTLVGFCYPTHGFNAPPIVLKFLRKFPKARCDVFLLNTRAGMKLYKLFTPGLSGLALILPAIILKLKGYKIRAYRPIDLPSNWISVHPGLKRKVVESIFSRCKSIMDKFSGKLLSGRRVNRGLYDLPIDIAISPIAIAYYIYGRFGLAKTFYASNECNNCDLCIKNCPVQAIKLIDSRYYWTFSCENCMKCMNNCPKEAIQTAHAYTILLWWLVLSPIPFLVLKIISKYGLIDSMWLSAHSRLISYLIILAIGLVFVFFGYKILHFLLRYTFFNILIGYSSLTKYKFWRRYKAPRY